MSNRLLYRQIENNMSLRQEAADGMINILPHPNENGG